MAASEEGAPDVPQYEHMLGVETLRHIPNCVSSLHNKDAIAICIPSEPNNSNGSSSSNNAVKLTYANLEQLVHSTATQLHVKAGLGRTATVSADAGADSVEAEAEAVAATVCAIVMPNCVEFILSFLAVPWTRCVSAPLNQDYTMAEFQFYMEDDQSQLVLVPADNNGIPEAEAAAAALGLPVYSVGWCKDDDNKKLEVEIKHKAGPVRIASAAAAVAETMTTTTSTTGSSDPPLLEFAPRPSDVALFLHTSGTTARPKGVPLTNQNLICSMNNIAHTYALTPHDAVLLVMPLFHVHGLMSACNTTLATGGCIILPPQIKFSASAFWHNASQATWVTCVPTIYQVLLLRYDQDYPKNAADDAPKFRFVRSCSAALAPSVLAEIEAKFHAPCLEAYAMTEASHQMCSNPLPQNGPRKAGSVGKGTGVAIAILDKENNVVTEPDIEGEVCIRGKNVTSGYLGVTSEVNQKAFAGGWFHTGDQGKLDVDGYLTLTGRIKELINRGGEKISPLEVDAAMLAHPSVAEAVSFAMPDPKYGEVVAAAIVLKHGQELLLDQAGLQDFLKDKLSPFKIPVKVFFDTTLPKTPTGKIQRRIVAEHFIK